MAATLTTPDSVLGHASAGAFLGFRPFQGSFETITRPGTGGPKRLGGLLVCRSRTLDGEVMVHDGIRVTTAPRTMIDLAPSLDERAIGRMFREAPVSFATAPPATATCPTRAPAPIRRVARSSTCTMPEARRRSSTRPSLVRRPT